MAPHDRRRTSRRLSLHLGRLRRHAWQPRLVAFPRRHRALERHHVRLRRRNPRGSRRRLHSSAGAAVRFRPRPAPHPARRGRGEFHGPRSLTSRSGGDQGFAELTSKCRLCSRSFAAGFRQRPPRPTGRSWRRPSAATGPSRIGCYPKRRRCRPKNSNDALRNASNASTTNNCFTG